MKKLQHHTHLLLCDGTSADLTTTERDKLLAAGAIYPCYAHAETDEPELPIYHWCAGFGWEDYDQLLPRREIFHFPSLAVPPLFGKFVQLPEEKVDGSTGYMVDPGEYYLPDDRIEESWIIMYQIGPDGLSLQAVIRESGERVPEDELEEHYRHYPNAWVQMAEVCLDHFQVSSTND